MIKKFLFKDRYILFIILFICIIIFTILLFPLSKGENTKLHANYTGEKLSSWKVNGKKVDFPYSLKYDKAKNIRQETTLPKKILDNTSIMLLSNYSIIHVYVDNKQIYSYGTVKQLPFGTMYGNMYLVIPIEKSYAGKTLCIETEQVYNLSKLLPFKTYTLPDVYIGDTYGIKLGIYHLNFWRIALISFLLILALLSFCFAIYQIIVGAYHNNVKEFLHFCTLCTCIAGWILGDSDLLQFVSNSNEANSFLIYISLSIIGIAYIGYCSEVLTMGKKVFAISRYVGLLIPFFNTFAFIFNICDPVELQTLTHIYMIYAVIITLIYAMRDLKNGPYAKALVLNIFMAVFIAFIGLTLYFLPNSAEDSSYAFFFGTSFVGFVFILLGISLVREVSFIRERLSMNIYKEMAYKDKLTTCGNRAGYDKAMEDGSKQSSHKKIILILFDLNHLKQVNDIYGHTAGDELIKGCATCLKESFEPDGKVYRLGGDEFATIIWDPPHPINHYYESLEKTIKTYNSKHHYLISVAKGYAEQELDNSNTINSIYNLADQNMYIDKERCHKELINESIINENV